MFLGQPCCICIKDDDLAGLALDYFFLLPSLSPDRYFLRQILKTGAKLGQVFAIFRNSVYTHVGLS